MTTNFSGESTHARSLGPKAPQVLLHKGQELPDVAQRRHLNQKSQNEGTLRLRLQEESEDCFLLLSKSSGSERPPAGVHLEKETCSFRQGHMRWPEESLLGLSCIGLGCARVHTCSRSAMQLQSNDARLGTPQGL